MIASLGIYAGHNSTAALVIDGSVVAAASEERFTGTKNFMGYPRAAVDYCLAQAGISGRELDRVTLPILTGAPANQSEHTQRHSASRRLGVSPSCTVCLSGFEVGSVH